VCIKLVALSVNRYPRSSSQWHKGWWTWSRLSIKGSHKKFIKWGRRTKKFEKPWPRESLKAPLDPGESTASFVVGGAHLWHHCDVVSGKNCFLRKLGKPVASIETTTVLKPNSLERKFLPKKVGKDLTFAMIITKVEAFLGGGPRVRERV